MANNQNSTMATSEQRSNVIINTINNNENEVMKNKNADGGANTTNANVGISEGRFEKLVNSAQASDFATEMGFVGKEREDYFWLLYLQNLPQTDYSGFKFWMMRLAWEITEIAGNKKGNQSTVWDLVSAMNVIKEKGNWVTEGNVTRGDVNSLVLFNLWSNTKSRIDATIKRYKFDEAFENEVMDKVYNLKFNNPYSVGDEDVDYLISLD